MWSAGAWLQRESDHQKWFPNRWVPRILDEDLFPVHDTLWDDLIDRCNDPSPRVRLRWRKVMSSCGNEWFEEERAKAIHSGRSPIIYGWGGQGVGKSEGVLAIEISLHELLLEDGIDAKLGVWSADYPTSVAKVSVGENLGQKFILHQDEDPTPTGAGSVEALRGILTLVDQLRYGRICQVYLDPTFNPAFKEKMTYGLEFIGYNPETGITLFILYNKFKRPMYYVTQPMRLDYMWLYEDYREFKKAHSHVIAKHGGGVSAVNMEDVQNKAQEIYAKFPELSLPSDPNKSFSDATKCTEDMVKVAAAHAGVVLITTRGKLAPVVDAVRRLFAEHHPRKPTKTVKETADKSAKASEYSRRGHREENLLWTKYMPELLKGTGAKIIYRGERGHEDASVIWDGVIYICDSKDYSTPLDERSDWIPYQKLQPEIDKYNDEVQRGEKTPILAVMYHEVNRNLWFVQHIEDPTAIKRDSQNRPLGSMKVDF